MKLGEGPKDPSKRDFLRLVRVGATLATTGATLGVLNKFSPRKDSDKAQTSEELKDLKDKKAIIEIEKKILGELEKSSPALEDICKGIVPAEMLGSSSNYRRAMLKTAGLAALTQPKKEHIDAAEKRVLDWMIGLKMKEGVLTVDSVRQTIQEKINRLTGE